MWLLLLWLLVSLSHLVEALAQRVSDRDGAHVLDDRHRRYAHLIEHLDALHDIDER